MVAVDTNVLVFAVIRNSPRHREAHSVLKRYAEGDLPWAIPWPCLYEFLRVVTHPRIYSPPMTLSRAIQDLERILESPTLTVLSEGERHATVMRRVLVGAGATGNLVHDAHIAALCIEHGITEIVTGDHDFSRFTALRVVDPFSTPPLPSAPR